MEGKFGGENVGEFGESSMIHQTKIINNLLADLLIRQTFFHQMLKTSQFANVSPHHQGFRWYGIHEMTAYEITFLLV